MTHAKDEEILKFIITVLDLPNFMTHAKDEEILKFIITVLDSYSQKLPKEEFLNTLITITKTMFTNSSIDKQRIYDVDVL